MRRIKGFTLLEVLVAVSILAGGIIIVATSWSGNFLRIRKANLYNNVALLLERKVTELQAEFKDKPLEEIVDKEGDFGSELAQYRWLFKVKEFEMPDLSAVLMGKDEGGTKDETVLNMIKQTTEFISKSVKEGTVTVFVKSGNKEVPFTITTYFIDYTREFNMGLPGGGGGSSGSAAGGGK